MKLNVPFFKQTTNLNCGPVALQMVLSYFGDTTDLKKIEELVGITEGKGVSTSQIAIAAAKLGYKVKGFSKHIGFNQDHLKHDYYKKYGNLDLEKSKRLSQEMDALGIKIKEKTVLLKKLLSFLKKDSLIIVLLDWNVVLGNNKGYQGHFVPIVGFDDENVFVHNHGFIGTKEFFSIKRELFDKARKADGTDEDFMIIKK